MAGLDRIREISKKFQIPHLGSNLTSYQIIKDIYSIKEDDEPFILSAGHAGLSLYVVLEEKYGIDAEHALSEHGVHPEICKSCHIDCTTGSLGNGIAISIGMALADRSKNVYCLVSDGEFYEGSCWESVNNIRKFNVDNLKLYLNFNGYSAYDTVPDWFIDNVKTILPSINIIKTSVEEHGLDGLSAHYVI